MINRFNRKMLSAKTKIFADFFCLLYFSVQQSSFEHLLNRGHNAYLCVIPCQTALQIYGVGFAERTVCGKFYRRTLNKCSRRHDNLAVISRHRRGNGGDVTVNGRRRLNSRTKRFHCFGRTEFHRLNNVVARFVAVRNNFVAEFFVYVSRKYSAFQCGRRDRQRKEKSLIKLRQYPEIRSDSCPSPGALSL